MFHDSWGLATSLQIPGKLLNRQKPWFPQSNSINQQQQVCGEGNGAPLQYSCLENPMDRGAWWAAVPGVTRSQTQLSDFPFTFHFHALEKEMAAHSSVLAWRIPGTGEPGGLPSLGSYRVGLKRLSSSGSGRYVSRRGLVSSEQSQRALRTVLGTQWTLNKVYFSPQ